MPTHLIRRAVALPAAVVLALGAAACGSTGTAPPAGSGPPAAGTLTVFAAASLTGAFTELGRVFESANPETTVRFNFGSSATLAQQIVQGAPADVFAAASPVTMKAVTAASLAGMPTVFARNRLRIAVPAGNPAGIGGLADLARPGVKVALCAVQAPCGAAALTALDAAGVDVTPVTLEQDVKAVLTKVELGEVDAALVYATDVPASGGTAEGISFPEADRAVNDYPIVALFTAPAGDAARRFVDLVLSSRGRDVLTAAGFEVPRS